MGVEKYRARDRVYWKVDEGLTLPDGRQVRFRQRKIPTREMAMALVAKARAEAFEGRFFDRVRTPKLTVAEAWAAYEPTNRRDVDGWRSDRGCAAHLIRHLGKRQACTLTEGDVDAYRNARLREKTQRKGPPAPATLDREVELLKRMLGYAVRCGTLPANPLARVRLLRKPNVRRTVLSEEMFARLVEHAEAELRPVLVVAYETGMRKREVLDLRWSQVDLEERTIRLAAEDTKTEEARVVFLTSRALTALRTLPRHIRTPYVFVNPETGGPWSDPRKAFQRACKAAELKGVWFHDLRRSFVTNARRRGVPESVVMRLSGHKTRAVFDRYNIVSDEDLRAAIEQIELRQSLDKVRSDDDLRNDEGPPFPEALRRLQR